MTPNDWVQIITAFGTLATTIGGVIVAVVLVFIRLEQTKQGVKVQAVEDKLDDNTRTTNQVDTKADTIVEQTNGVTETLQKSVDQLLDRVEKLEGYNRDSNHRVLDAVNAMHLKVAELAAKPPVAQPVLSPSVPSPPAKVEG